MKSAFIVLSVAFVILLIIHFRNQKFLKKQIIEVGKLGDQLTELVSGALPTRPANPVSDVTVDK